MPAKKKPPATLPPAADPLLPESIPAPPPRADEKGRPIGSGVKQGSHHQRYLRQLAAAIYAFDPEQCSIEQLAARPMFREVAPTSMVYWSQQDGWTAKREEVQQHFLKQWDQHLIDTVGLSLLSERKLLLDNVVEIRKKALGHLLDKHVFEGHVDDPKTCAICGRRLMGHENPFFGMSTLDVLKVLERVMPLEDALTLEAAKHVAAAGKPGEDAAPQALSGPGGSAEAPAGLSAHEARLAAHTVLRLRAGVPEEKLVGPSPTAPKGPPAETADDDIVDEEAP